MPSTNRNLRAKRKTRPDNLETEIEQQRSVISLYADRDPPPTLERIGDILRRRRQQRGDELDHIADYLCIRKSFLIALENNDYDDLPADAYVIGFLRSYATYLGFDGAEAINRYRNEMAGRRRKPLLVLPTPISEGRTPSVPIMLGASITAILIYCLWYMLSTGDRTALNTPLPLPTAPTQEVVVTPAVAAAASIPTAPAPVAPTPKAVADKPTTKNAPATTPAPAVASAPPVAVSAPAPAEVVAPPATAPAPVQPRLAIRAEKESWVLITDSKGKAILDHVMKAGEVFPVPNEEGLKLTTGNSGAIVLVLDGKDQPRLSRDSSTLHDIPLTFGKPR